MFVFFQTVALIVEDDSILSECNSLDCHLVPVGSSSHIPTDLFITHKMKLEWSRDGYSVAALNNFLYVGGGYNPSEGKIVITRITSASSYFLVSFFINRPLVLLPSSLR